MFNKLKEQIGTLLEKYNWSFIFQNWIYFFKFVYVAIFVFTEPEHCKRATLTEASSIIRIGCKENGYFQNDQRERKEERMRLHKRENVLNCLTLQLWNPGKLDTP